MTRQELVEQTVRDHYKKYNISLPWEKLPWSGELIETKLNDGTIELVDRMVEFTLCSLYSFYYIDRYCFTIPPKGGPVPFKLFDFQKQALDDFQRYGKIIFRKCRQIGASVISGCYALWRANFQKAQNIRIISLQLTDAQEFKEKTIDINYEAMPGFLKSKATRDGNNQTRLKLVNKSQIRVLAKSKNAGRGGTPSLVIIDEAAFNEWMDQIWKSIEPSLDKGGDCIVISTTNGVGNWYHLTYTKAEQDMNEFHAIYIPWWRYPDRSNPWLKDILDGKIADVATFVRQKEREQLDYTGDPKLAPWLWKRRANAKTEKDFEQEILAKFLGSGETVITPKSIGRLIDQVVDPKWVDRLPNEAMADPIHGLWVWEDVRPGASYALCADVAKGSAQDFSAFHIYDVHSNRQVAEYKELIPTDKFGKLIKRVAKYYNFAFVIIESNGLGIAVFNEVYLAEDDSYQNTYVTQRGRSLMGWETTPKSRNLLVDDFFKDVENEKTHMVSSRFVDEVKVFNWGDDGKAQAMKGWNDDLVMAHAIYCHLRDYAISSKPMGFSTNAVSAVDVDIEVEEGKWAQYDEVHMERDGMDYGEWCWLQGVPTPESYKTYKATKRREEDEVYDPSSISMDS